MTGAVAAITVTGTIYGAGLKTDQELKHVRIHRNILSLLPLLQLHTLHCVNAQTDTLSGA